jgi:hypothetical protein
MQLHGFCQADNILIRSHGTNVKFATGINEAGYQTHRQTSVCARTAPILPEWLHVLIATKWREWGTLGEAQPAHLHEGSQALQAQWTARAS